MACFITNKNNKNNYGINFLSLFQFSNFRITIIINLIFQSTLTIEEIHSIVYIQASQTITYFGAVNMNINSKLFPKENSIQKYKSKFNTSFDQRTNRKREYTQITNAIFFDIFLNRTSQKIIDLFNVKYAITSIRSSILREHLNRTIQIGND